MVFIYTLSHPITGEIRYIGKTNGTLTDRLAKHLVTKERNHRSSWIKNLLNQNLKPVIEVLEEVTHEEWAGAERFWIAQFKAWGYRLINGTEGGDCGVISPQCRAASLREIRSRPKWKFKETGKKIGIARSKPVLQFSKDGKFLQEFPSVSAAAKAINGSISHIAGCCNKRPRRRSHLGFVWKYKIKI